MEHFSASALRTISHLQVVVSPRQRGETTKFLKKIAEWITVGGINVTRLSAAIGLGHKPGVHFQPAILVVPRKRRLRKVALAGWAPNLLYKLERVSPAVS